MFSKISRYRKLADIVSIDAKGRTLESKILRLLPEVSGTFYHTVEQVDRLDHMAHKYYKLPGKWWRICDANPEFMSPQEFLGKDAIVTARFPIEWEGLEPTWPGLIKSLLQEVGIKHASMGRPDQPFSEMKIQDGTLIASINSGLTSDLNTGVFRQELSTSLEQALQDEGVILTDNIRFRSIDNNDWRITDQTAKRLYILRSEEGVINVYDSVVRYSWVITISYNEMNVTAQDVTDRMTALGFAVGPAENIGRVGKNIIIPQNIVG